MKESTGFPLLRVLKFSCADLLVNVLLRFLHSILFLIEFYQKTMHCKKQEYSPTSALGFFQFSPLFHLPHFPVLNENVYAVQLLIGLKYFLQHNDAILQHENQNKNS